MTVLAPWYLLALLPVVALGAAYVLAQRRRVRYAVRFAALPMLDRVVPERPRWRRHLVSGLVFLALLLLGAATARPQIDLRVPYERATLLVAIDVSQSMTADDVPPSRMEAAKAAAAAFVEELPDTINVGAVSFAGSASVIAPASTDHAAVASAIRALDTANGGTAIGEAVISSVGEIQRLADSGDTEAPERIPARIVLLSDGASTQGRAPEEAAPLAEQAQVPVDTIAYGTRSGVSTYQGDRTAVPVDEDTLRALATSTGGSFYAAESGSELADAYSDIGSLVGWRVEPVDVTPYFALAALLLAAVGGALSLRWFARLV